MKTDILTRKEVEQLVQRFYDRVRTDELLAPVFRHVDWPNHLPIMYDFWSSILIGDMSYQGTPFPKHRNLPINAEHFSRWLKLFRETVDTEFSGPVAEEAKTRANTIALVFQSKMGLLR